MIAQSQAQCNTPRHASIGAEHDDHKRTQAGEVQNAPTKKRHS
jgi:hypothetical protein